MPHRIRATGGSSPRGSTGSPTTTSTSSSRRRTRRRRRRSRPSCGARSCGPRSRRRWPCPASSTPRAAPPPRGVASCSTAWTARARCKCTAKSSLHTSRRSIYGSTTSESPRPVPAPSGICRRRRCSSRTCEPATRSETRSRRAPSTRASRPRTSSRPTSTPWYRASKAFRAPTRRKVRRGGWPTRRAGRGSRRRSSAATTARTASPGAGATAATRHPTPGPMRRGRRCGNSTTRRSSRRYADMLEARCPRHGRVDPGVFIDLKALCRTFGGCTTCARPGD
mmetsp:Transcript_5915/g.18816  ORF Transcript_5915/g.18816 Transcript_5915/m.18816 type:complete len:281 (+) Transcript_5915:38-880(+)